MTASPSQTNLDETSLWGLDSPIAQFEALLAQSKPALILVTGKPGSGKSSFLREVGARAAALRWKTAQSDDRGDLEVGPGTMEAEFSKRVLELLGFSDALSGARQAFGAAAVRRPRNLPTSLSSIMAGSAAEAGALGLLSVVSAGEPRLDPAETSPQLHPLAARLTRLARTSASGDTPRGILLVIDGYRPDPEFASWFEGVLLKELPGVRAPVIVAVADEVQNLRGLQPLADHVISLDSLDRLELQLRFEALGRELSPPMESSEVDKYVAEALERPQIIGPLRRVLALARRTI